MEAPRLSEEELNDVYSWVDSIPLSRPKKNISRDFSDGVLMAEIISQHIPRIVELHNYSAANRTKEKLYNWGTLNTKVFRKMDFQINQLDVNAIVECKPEVIERILKVVKNRLEDLLNNPNEGDSPDRQSANSSRIGKRAINNPQNQGNQRYSNDQFQQQAHQQQQDEIIWEKDQTIGELRETIDILELKIKKLEDLLSLKDNKIRTLQNKMAEHGLY